MTGKDHWKGQANLSVLFFNNFITEYTHWELAKKSIQPELC